MSMTKKRHNHRLQTNPWCRKEETQNVKRDTIYVISQGLELKCLLKVKQDLS